MWSPEDMPFRDYRSFFQPEELDALTAAYGAAWQHLYASSIGLTPVQSAEMKRRLAQIILASACTGERDTERLREIAMRGLSPRLVKELEPKHC
jgi:hypothetical protein